MTYPGPIKVTDKRVYEGRTTAAEEEKIVTVRSGNLIDLYIVDGFFIRNGFWPADLSRQNYRDKLLRSLCRLRIGAYWCRDKISVTRRNPSVIALPVAIPAKRKDADTGSECALCVQHNTSANSLSRRIAVGNKMESDITTMFSGRMHFVPYNPVIVLQE